MGQADSTLNHFAPGDRASLVMPSRWGGSLRPVSGALPGSVCEVELPSRLHASVIDMNLFGPGTPGGGGIGFGVALTCRTKVTITDTGVVVSKGNRPGVAAHLGRLFKRMTGHEGGIEIETTDHGRRHLGLGSSIATVTGVAAALNEVFGRPLNLRDMRKLIAHNYCEEAPGEPEKLVKGFETNLGAMVGLHGGMVVATGDCELLYRVDLPSEMRALLMIPKFHPGVSSSGDEEAEALLGAAREYDLRDRELKAYKVFLELMPAMIAGDFESVGKVVHDLAYLGSKRAECMLHGNRGAEIFSMIEELKAEGAEIVSMSSVGPAVFAMSAKPKVWKSWKKRIENGGSDSALIVPVDNSGARVRLDGVPIPYTMEPWWNRPQGTFKTKGKGRVR